MSKAVLISIKPEWCSLIATGNKTVEIRKSIPKLDTPFKCYIYCTKTSKGWFFMNSPDVRRDGKVIGEFTCDKIEWIGQNELVVVEDAEKALKGSCLSINEIYKYLGLPKSKDDEKYRECFGWHISDLKIYDRPRELSEFRMSEMPLGLRYEDDTIKRPPQSWRYVEEREDNA